MEARAFIAREVQAVARGDLDAKVAAVADLILDARRPSLRAVAETYGVARSTLSRLRERVMERGRVAFR